MAYHAKIQLLGKGWYGQIVAMDYTVPEADLLRYRKVDRESLLDWLGTHAGNFSQVIDFSATIHVPQTECGNCGHPREHIIPVFWDSDENENTYMDCMFPLDDFGPDYVE